MRSSGIDALAAKRAYIAYGLPIGGVSLAGEQVNVRLSFQVGRSGTSCEDKSRAFCFLATKKRLTVGGRQALMLVGCVNAVVVANVYKCQ